jgi:thioredoxin reductase (NADPH)
LLAQAGVDFDPVELTPRFEPETFETNVPGIYLVGNVTTGRQTGKIFIENGRFHGERVIQVIAERLRDARAGKRSSDEPERAPAAL